MSKSSRRRPLLRFGTLAFAVVLGAGAAFASVAADDLQAILRAKPVAEPGTRLVNADGGRVPAAAPSRQTTTTAPPKPTTTPPPPGVSAVLPFNAKLTSVDIPAVGGGVRRGGCSGSLIAPEWIVTAGHCFHDLADVPVSGVPPYTMTVTIGKLKDSDAGGRTARVVDVRQSPINDLALARLSVPVTDVEPLALADRQPVAGQQLEFAGWGSLSATNIVQSDHLKRGRFTVSVLTPTTLEMLPVEARTVENSPCPEDSGSPFFSSDDDRRGTLVAIVSTGPTCPQPGAEIVARVDVQADWIREQTGIAP